MNTVAAVVRQVEDDPGALGLGEMEILRAHPSCGAVEASLVLEDPATGTLYVVELQLGPTDDRQVIRVVERWAAERKRHSSRRCFAVLVAEQIEPRYQNVLAAIGKAVPMLVVEVDLSDGPARFRPVVLC
jgi:hypothetical protein